MIAQAWKLYEEILPKEADEIQHSETRKAFYAGATAASIHIANAIVAATVAGDTKGATVVLDTLEKLIKECEEMVRCLTRK